MTPPSDPGKTVTPLDAALAYAALGWHVFPISATDKTPITRHGHLDATTDADTIRAWWSANPDARIGVWLRRSRLICIDVDVADGKDGLAEFAALEMRLGPLPRRVVQRSGRGGIHVVMRDPSGDPSGRENVFRGRLASAVDVKHNGYILVEPSGTYRWEVLDDPAHPPLVPEAWIAAMTPERAESVGAKVETWATAVPAGALPDDRASALRSDLRALGPRGRGGGTTLQAIKLVFHHYGRSVADPASDPGSGVPYLLAWNDASGRPHAAHELDRQVTRISALTSELDPDRGWAARPHGFIPAWVRALSTSAHAPVALGIAELRAYLGAAVTKGKRSGKGERRVEGERLAKVLGGEMLPREDTDALAYAALALVAAAPPVATDQQLGEILAPCAAHIVDPETNAPLDMVHVIHDAREHARESRATDADRRVAVDEEDAPADDEDLRSRLVMGPTEDAGPRACGSNIEMILHWSEDLRGRLRFNELTKKIEIAGGRFANEPDNGLDVAVKNWLETHWSIYAATASVGEQILRAARRWGAYDPVADYLTGLRWDGAHRLDTWLERYCGARTKDAAGADVADYVRTVGARWLISAAARGLSPGAKVDTVLVLEGPQGIKKSTALGILGGAWFSDTPLVIGDKDSRMLAGQRWIIEIAELASIRRTDVEAQRNFLSQRHDDFRPPYGRVTETFARHCVFAGTMNPSDDDDAEYLVDETGNRRWWCVRVTKVDAEALTADRDQLWAEAVHRFREGERWWLEPDEQITADAVAATRRPELAWVDPLLRWWEALPKEKRSDPRALGDIASAALGIDAKDLPRQTATVSSALRAAGFRREQGVRGGVRARRWIRRGS